MAKTTSGPQKKVSKKLDVAKSISGPQKKVLRNPEVKKIVSKSEVTKPISGLNNAKIQISGFNCRFCNYLATDKNLIKDHIEEKHQSKTAKKVKDCLKIQTQRKTGNKREENYRDSLHKMENHFCGQCQKAFMNERSLKFHIKSSHTSKKIFRMKTPSHLVTPGGLFQCYICDVKMSTKFSLERHIRLLHQVESKNKNGNNLKMTNAGKSKK